MENAGTGWPNTNIYIKRINHPIPLIYVGYRKSFIKRNYQPGALR